MKRALFWLLALAVILPIRAGIVNPGGGGTGTGVMLVGKILVVDGVNGNDGTGTRGHAELPYLTPAAAKTAAQSGDSIDVLPGTYETKNLLKNGVNWMLEPGVTLQNTTDNTVGVFDDSSAGANSAVTCEIKGFGDIKQQTSGAIAAVNVTNSGSNVSLTCRNITELSANGAVVSSAGTLFVKCETIFGQFNAGAGVSGAGPWWLGGNLFVDAQQILCSASSICVYTVPNGGATGDFFVRAHKISQTGGNYLYQSAGTEGGLKTWIVAELMTATSSTANTINIQTNKSYITCQKLEGATSNPLIAVGGATPGSLWLTAQKVTANHASSTAAMATVTSSGSFALFDVKQWEPIGPQGYAVSVGASAVAVVSGGFCDHSATNGSAFGVTSASGKLTVIGTAIKTANTYYDLDNGAGGTLIAAGVAYDTAKANGTISTH